MRRSCPGKTNVFIPFLDVCVIDAATLPDRGVGFSYYNWKTNKVSSPVDVFTPSPDATALPMSRWYGSPVVSGNTVSLYTTCCAPGAVSITTIPANIAALSNPASYVSTPVAGLTSSYMLTIAPPSLTHPFLTMYQAWDTDGAYHVSTANSPAGPWTLRSTGILPRCAGAAQPCNSFATHPEISPMGRLVVSYYVFGYGPAIGPHPDPAKQISHVVWASLPF